MTTLGGIASKKNIGAGLIVGGIGGASKNGTSHAEIDGAIFDRIPEDGQGTLESCIVFVCVTTTNIDVGQTCALTLTVQHADLDTDLSDADAADMADVASTHQPTDVDAAVITGTGATQNAVFRYDLRLTELKRFIRLQIDPTFSQADAGDIAHIVFFVLAGGGNDSNPLPVGDWIPTYAA